MPIDSWSTTAASNATALGIDIGEGADAANINNAIRELMAQVRAELTDAVLGILAQSTVGGIRTALDVPEATDALNSIGGLTPAADRLPYYTGSAAAALATFTSFARTLLDDADASAARTTLGAIGISASSLTFPKGFVKLTNGLHIMWGSKSFAGGGTSTAVNYTTEMGTTITLATGSLAVICGGFTGDTDRNGPFTTSCSTTGFNAFCRTTSNSTGFWIAVGV